MIHALLSLVISAVVLLVVGHLVPGFELDGFGPALIAAIVVGVVNATLGFVLHVLTFPLAFLTLGLFALIVNAFLLKVAAALVPGFRIRGFLPAFWGALLIAIANVLLGQR